MRISALYVIVIYTKMTKRQHVSGLAVTCAHDGFTTGVQDSNDCHFLKHYLSVVTVYGRH